LDGGQLIGGDIPGEVFTGLPTLEFGFFRNFLVIFHWIV
jgi:hypothetical protein